MTSVLTSSYNTIKSVSENPKASGNEVGQETTDISSNQQSPSASEEQETKEDDSCQSKPIEPDPSEDGVFDENPIPIPLPRSKMLLHTPENQMSTDHTTNHPSTSCDSTKPAPPESTYVLATEPTAPSYILAKMEVKRSSSFPRPERPPPPTHSNTCPSAAPRPPSVISDHGDNQASSVQRSSSFPRPERPPPPSLYYGARSSTPKLSSMSSDNEDSQESIASSVSPGPTDEEGNLFGIYRSMNEEIEKPAVPPRPSQPKQPYVSSASLTSQLRPPPPAFRPPPPPEAQPVYDEIQFPPYLHILPEHDKSVVTERPIINNCSSARRSSMAVTQETLEMLRWLKIVSKTNYMAPSLYGASLEEEIRTFHQTSMNLKKALRLFNLLMMKRGETLRDHIAELTSTSDALDKALKRKKTIQLAGGTTGAVGGVTAVVGLALAPVTFGASLIATAVGAGMVASAGGVSAHVAKTKKKIITRNGVEKLLTDYTDKVKDPEQCLGFILSGMNEVRRFDCARLQRAGAQPEALKTAQLTQAVLNNMDTGRRNSGAQTGGMSSERLLQGFAKELDYYFTEKEGQKLKKSRKGRFSSRVRLLAKNLHDELDYLNHMWELFN